MEVGSWLLYRLYGCCCRRDTHRCVGGLYAQRKDCLVTEGSGKASIFHCFIFERGEKMAVDTDSFSAQLSLQRYISAQVITFK